jgi:hypothetical protein
MQGRSRDAAWLGIAVVMAVLVHRYLKQSCSRSCVGSIDDSSHHHLAAPVPPPLEDPGVLGVAQFPPIDTSAR